MVHILASATHIWAPAHDRYYNVILLAARLIVGPTLSAHGFFKFFGGGKIPGTARWFDSIGMRPGKVHAVMAASTETGAGILLALGLLTPLAAAGFVGVMFVAAWTVNRVNGFYSANHGFEFNLILATVAVLIAGIGPGKYSADWALGLNFAFNPPVAIALSAGFGLVTGIAQVAIFFRPLAPDPAPDPDPS